MAKRWGTIEIGTDAEKTVLAVWACRTSTTITVTIGARDMRKETKAKRKKKEIREKSK